jgi:ribonuclease BN (tRNA processing enzyme)
MKVLLRIIGSSPAWPNPGGANAGYLVESNGARLLLDCGPGVLSRLRRDDLLPVDAVVVSHLHLDHWGDLVPWAWLNLRAGPGSRPALWLQPDGAAELAAFGARFGHRRMFEEAFELRAFAPREPFAAAGFGLEPLAVEHFGLPAFGFRVRSGGATLAYSGDTAPCPALAELARGADLFLCEATLASGDEDSRPRGHLSADEALAVGAERIVLTHRPSELPLPEGIARAVEGDTIEIP